MVYDLSDTVYNHSEAVNSNSTLIHNQIDMGRADNDMHYTPVYTHNDSNMKLEDSSSSSQRPNINRHLLSFE